MRISGYISDWFISPEALKVDIIQIVPTPTLLWITSLIRRC
jgi:hypothetical protein